MTLLLLEKDKRDFFAIVDNLFLSE
jgi:hypothetical protein